METLRLFNAVLVGDKTPRESAHKDHYQRFLQESVPHGFIADPKAFAFYPTTLFGLVKRSIGAVHGVEINSSFHKSWEKVANASMEQLVIEQLIHYVGTYGREGVGLEAECWLPLEELNVPDVDGLRLTIIRGLTKDEMRDELLKLVNSGIALSDQSVRDAANVGMQVELPAEQVKNREVRTMLFEMSGTVPSDGAEFLRFLIYRLTGESMVIKSPALIKKLHENADLRALSMLRLYEQVHGIDGLASIFLRYKPLFLALRQSEGLKQFVNRVRRRARVAHQPMGKDVLNSVTADIANGSLDVPKLASALGSASIFRKIRLAYALKYRTTGATSIVHKVRNGKSWAHGFAFPKQGMAREVLATVLDSIAQDMSEHVGMKRVLIPEGIDYALPATQRQFTGNFPSGTRVCIASDMIVGIWWKNVNGLRIDLDLSLRTLDGRKYGWDGALRGDGILFSGDITDAPYGASELFRVPPRDKALLLSVNYYNFVKGVPVPFKIVVGEESNFSSGYVLDPSKIKAASATVLDKREMVLGVIMGDEFIFNEFSIGGGRTSRNTEAAKHARTYADYSARNPISLREVLQWAGAEIVSEGKADIDLSPEVVDKNSFLRLLS